MVLMVRSKYLALTTLDQLQPSGRCLQRNLRYFLSCTWNPFSRSCQIHLGILAFLSLVRLFI